MSATGPRTTRLPPIEPTQGASLLSWNQVLSIEERRIERGKTAGFERQYARVTKLYFGGMARHLSDLRTILRSGAQLAYVVGDQASYLRVMIRTGQLLLNFAQLSDTPSGCAKFNRQEFCHTIIETHYVVTYY